VDQVESNKLNDEQTNHINGTIIGNLTDENKENDDVKIIFNEVQINLKFNGLF
jgi:hypothetical protein